MGDHTDNRTASTGLDRTDDREVSQTDAGKYRGESAAQESARFNLDARYTGRQVSTEQILHEDPQSGPRTPYSVKTSAASSASDCISRWHRTSHYLEVSERACLKSKERHDAGAVTDHVRAAAPDSAVQAVKSTLEPAHEGLALVKVTDEPSAAPAPDSMGVAGDHTAVQSEPTAKHAEEVLKGHETSCDAENSQDTDQNHQETHDTGAAADQVHASAPYSAGQAAKNPLVPAQAGVALVKDPDKHSAAAAPDSTGFAGDHAPEHPEPAGQHAEGVSIGDATSRCAENSEDAGPNNEETHDTGAGLDQVHASEPNTADQAGKSILEPAQAGLTIAERRDEPAAVSQVSTQDDGDRIPEQTEPYGKGLFSENDDAEYSALAASARLWKYKGVPFTEPDRTEDRISGILPYEGGRAVGARVRGKSHKHAGSSCDDWFEMGHEGDILFVAVSDGAGSRRFSRVGSKTACETAVAQMKTVFSALTDTEEKRECLMAGLSAPLDSEAFQNTAHTVALVLQMSVLKAIAAVKQAFEERKPDPRYNTGDRQLELGDLACTLLVAAAVPLDNGEHFMVSCQIGDGAVVSIDTKGPYPEKVRILGNADSGEYTGQTEFITSHEFAEPADLMDRTKVSRARCDLMMVMTDGVADDYYPGSMRMTELYYDLIANGILTRPSDTEGSSAGSTELGADFPLTFPWVDNQDTQVSLNYADRICAKNRIKLKDLWDRRDVLARAAQQVAPSLGDTDAKRLEMWLDNYVRRSSYDDRTLVLMMLDGREENG